MADLRSKVLTLSLIHISFASFAILRAHSLVAANTWAVRLLPLGAFADTVDRFAAAYAAIGQPIGALVARLRGAAVAQ